MLSRQKEQFASAFYRLHRKHLFRIIMRMAILLMVFAILTGINLVSFLKGTGDAKHTGVAVSVFGAILLFLAWATYCSIRNQLSVRLVPYFEQKLGTVDTWLAGRDALRHSRQLDEIAIRLDVRPLSEFASGDDLIRGEKLVWFPPEEGLNTIERLLQTDTKESLPPAVIPDLTLLRDALRSACSKSSRFCLLLREGSSVSGIEMERRKGSFF